MQTPMMRVLVCALVSSVASHAWADEKRDKKARECKSECKSQCAPLANTGWSSERRGYADCDAECHRTYDGCKFYCDPE